MRTDCITCTILGCRSSRFSQNCLLCEPNESVLRLLASKYSQMTVRLTIFVGEDTQCFLLAGKFSLKFEDEGKCLASSMGLLTLGSTLERWINPDSKSNTISLRSIRLHALWKRMSSPVRRMHELNRHSPVSSGLRDPKISPFL